MWFEALYNELWNSSMLKRARNIQLASFRKKGYRGVINIHLVLWKLWCARHHTVLHRDGEGLGGINIQCLIGKAPAVLICPTCVRALPQLLYVRTLIFSVSVPHVHRCLNSGYMPALQSAPMLNCVASLCSLNCAGQATGSKGRAGGGHSFSV